MRWFWREGALPQHPYRDSAIVYGVMAAVIVGFTAVTGGEIVKGVGVAALFFLVATGWSWWRFRQRLQEGERQ